MAILSFWCSRHGMKGSRSFRATLAIACGRWGPPPGALPGRFGKIGSARERIPGSQQHRALLAALRLAPGTHRGCPYGLRTSLWIRARARAGMSARTWADPPFSRVAARAENWRVE